MTDYGDYSKLFQKATDLASPYPYQRSLAKAPELPNVLCIPTGCGKTAAVVLGWLWRRRFHPDASKRQSTPRRLVYCLPMRVLVEQTVQCCRRWLANLGILAEESPKSHPADRVAVHQLMGGDLELDWDRYPERDQILVGTQDMLLSRALNRGYAMSRFRWPVQFALLGNDCHWVFDEIQLMGNGLATSSQLQAFRRLFGNVSPVSSTWMSATLKPEWLSTVDFVDDVDAKSSLELGEADRKFQHLARRLGASKTISRADSKANDDIKSLAQLIRVQHKKKTLTLVVLNTVKRAVAVHTALMRQKPDADVVLIHSRFRPGDRKARIERLLATPGSNGTIAVSTQVVEAGIDVSARTLITDLAPWSSLVQRFGRCNRYGENDNSVVIWIDLADKKAAAAPYEPEDLALARETLAGLSSVAPSDLPEVELQLNLGHVIRRRDLVDLFDTTPDLAGADIDVSRFVRSDDDLHVQVFWREIDEAPGPEEKGPHTGELCSVSIADLKNPKDLPKWRWDYLEKGWVRIRRDDDLYPGLVVLLRTRDGCYSPTTGWTGKKKDKPNPVRTTTIASDYNDGDRWAETSRHTLAEHSNAVVEELGNLLSALPGLDSRWQTELVTAARWHDAGKAHPIFQEAVSGDLPARDSKRIWAKSGGRSIAYGRRGFRHELASGLAMIQVNHSDLSAYLAAAHHGKVRLSIRSLPHEKGDPEHLQRRFARGVWQGDTLCEADLGGGVTLHETKLNLSPMELGDNSSGASWLGRMLALRDDPELGPFRLAYLEMLLRVADWRASAREGVADD